MPLTLKRWIVILLWILISSLATASEYLPSLTQRIQEPWRWHELEQLQGLSLTCGAESEDGVLWFGIRGGVVSFDGYSVRELKFPGAFADSRLFQILPISGETFYAYTSKGIVHRSEGDWTILDTFSLGLNINVRDYMVRNSHGIVFAYAQDRIVQLNGNQSETALSLENHSSAFAIDSQDKIWLTDSTENLFLNIQTGETGLVTPIQKQSFKKDGNSTAGNNRLIASPQSDKVWAISWRPDDAAQHYSPESQKWEKQDLSHLSGNNAHVGAHRINKDSVLFVSKTNLLIEQNSEWSVIEAPGKRLPIANVFAFTRNNGNLILGGQGDFIYEVDTSDSQWGSYNHLHFHCETANKSQWFLNFSGEVLEYDAVYDSWIQHRENVIDTPVGMMRTRDDYVWAYGSHEGIPSLSYFNGRSWKLERLPKLEAPIGHTSSIQLEDGRVLFGSSVVIPNESQGGLVAFTKKGQSYQAEHIPPPSVPIRPASMAEDNKGKLWASGNDVYTIEPNLESFEIATAPPNQERWIDHIVADQKGEIWTALWSRGLFRKNDNSWTQISSPNQIASNQVTYILADSAREDNLWIATNSGISRFDGKNWIPQSLPSDVSFQRENGTLRQSENGDIWINFAPRSWYFRTHGTSSIPPAFAEKFHSIRYRPNRTPPVAEIVSFDNKTTRPSSIHITWKGIDKWSNTPSNALRYSHRMGDEDWSEFSPQPHITLVNIPNGEHRFQVRAIDKDGNLTSEPAVATITVLPPYWQRTWFIVAVFAITLTIIVLLALLFRQGIRHVLKLEEFKIQFFTNISHELRTPLTVIMAPLEALLSKHEKSEDRPALELAHKSARKMQILIDQLLDFRSAEQGSIKINRSHYDLVDCVKETIRLIKPLAAERHQNLDLQCSLETCKAWFDPEKVETILRNLLSNAIKYTQDYGDIHLRVEVTEHEDQILATIVVEDNGSGIPKSGIDNIWEAFYRADNIQSHKVRGSGIGLSYTKNLVEACEGSIKVDSPIVEIDGKEQGTRFTVSLPLLVDAPELQTPEKGTEQPPKTSELNPDSPAILLVEDDDDIRKFIANELRKDYQVVEAQDGKKGSQLASELIPDIVLSDVMMPEMDGRELCRLVKSSEATNHIPVILLTALKSDEHEMSGLTAGADDYIAKPVNLAILKQRIHNLLASRQTIHDKYKELNPEAKYQTKEITSNPAEEAFLAKALKIVEANLYGPTFDVIFLANAMGMSRMTLYRKFKAITGQSPGYFIRSVRMKTAAEHLKANTYNISEISDLVGFAELSHFSTAFKKFFKQSPSQYREQHRGKNSHPGSDHRPR